MAYVGKVSGVLSIDGSPVDGRTVKAFSYSKEVISFSDSDYSLSAPLGESITNANGEYEIYLAAGYIESIFVVAFDNYGRGFVGGDSVVVDDVIHPSTPNGLVYVCNGAGDLPVTEPVWPTDTEVSHGIGTASFSAVPFLRPKVHGPITPDLVENETEELYGAGDFLFLSPSKYVNSGLVQFWVDENNKIAAIKNGSKPLPEIVDDYYNGRYFARFDNDQGNRSLSLTEYLKPFASGASRITLVLVFEWHSSPSGYPGIIRLETSGGTSDIASIYARSGAFEIGYRRVSSDSYRSISVGSLTTGVRFMCVDFNPGGGSVSAITDGASVVGSYAASGTLGSLGDWSINASGGSSAYPDFSMGELIVLIDADDQKVDKVCGTVAHEWGLADDLPAAHPYKAAPP